MKTILASLLVLPILGWLAAPAAASWAAVPIEVLVDQASLIVQGKVVRIDKGFERNGRLYELAVVEVSGTLKGEKLTHVKIAQPAAGGLATSVDIRFKPDQTGIWLLKKESDKDLHHWVTHPSQHQPVAEKDALVKLVEQRSKLSAGKEVKGLVARGELIRLDNYYELRFSLKNVSDKPIAICEYVGNKPLEVEWLGPDGKPRTSHHYDWLALARIKQVDASNFVSLLPGEVRFLNAGQGGILFLLPVAKPTPAQNALEAGNHKITIRYSNKDDGKSFSLKNVWTGTVSAQEVSVLVK